MHFDKKRISKLQQHMKLKTQLWADFLNVPSNDIEQYTIFGYSGLLSKHVLLLCNDQLLDIKLKNYRPAKCLKRIQANSIKWNILNETEEEITNVNLSMLKNEFQIYTISFIIHPCSLDTTDSFSLLEYYESDKQCAKCDSDLVIPENVSMCLSQVSRNSLAIGNVQSKLQEKKQPILRH